MKSMREMYPLSQWDKEYHSDNSEYFSAGDYQPLLESFEYEILAQADERDYQGDSFVLFRDHVENRVGFLAFGWGSCSGCDALQACHTVYDAEQLQTNIHNSIVWRATFRELGVWILDDVQELKWYYRKPEFRTLASQIVNRAIDEMEERDPWDY